MIYRTFYTISVVVVTLLLLWIMALAVVGLAQMTIDGLESLMQWARGEFG